jgi:hypothetical protein
MKPVIAFVAAFVVATSASTGAKVMMTKPHVVPDSTKVGVDSTGTDSSAAKPVPRPALDSAKKEPATAAKQSRVVPAAESTGAPIVAPPKSKSPPATATKPAPATAAAPVVADTVVEVAERRIAKVFTAMEPKQAAKVLEHMADSDVQIILGYVGPRQAASIMAELPPERVAALSKRAMQAKTK